MCVCERERGKECEGKSVCAGGREEEREYARVCVRVRACVFACVCVFVYVCVYMGERERVDVNNNDNERKQNIKE